jgi:hypothetical protein
MEGMFKWHSCALESDGKCVTVSKRDGAERETKEGQRREDEQRDGDGR